MNHFSLSPLYRIALLFLFVGIMSCGTHSHLLPADVIPAGKKEVFIGRSFNSLQDVDGILGFAYGFRDRYEFRMRVDGANIGGIVRWGVLSSIKHPLAFSLLGGIAKASLKPGSYAVGELTDERVWTDVLTFGASVGRRWEVMEPYLGYRMSIYADPQTQIQSLKLGSRIHGTRAFLGIEFGYVFSAQHERVFEGAISLGGKL
ncbi:hypothetical protein GW916_04265 [bacterium]|nr:hypothetical protein [bacterium]